MPSFAEMNHKVSLSIGALMFLVGATFFVTTFYIKQSTLEAESAKRFDTIDERLNKLEEHVYDIVKDHVKEEEDK